MEKKINDLLNRKPNKNDDIVITENGEIICNQRRVSNKFNNYFVNAAHNLLKELGESNNKFQDYLKDPNTHSFFLKETTPAEVQKLLNNLNTRKASDIYGISPNLVKLSSECIKKCLSQIFTASFDEGIVPNKFKSAVIYPIHKGETKMLCSNYRSMSILPIFSKILEKLIGIIFCININMVSKEAN